jgi:hypothetical protein
MPPFVPYGPAFYPRVILLVLGALAAWLIVQAIMMRPGGTGTESGRTEPFSGSGKARVGFAVFFAYVVALSLIGYLAATFLFVLGMSWVMGPRRARELPKLGAVALATTVVTYLVFERYLHVFLPRGFWF